MNIEIHDKAMGLLTKAQHGDRYAYDDLIVLIQTNYMGRRIGRYINKNRKVDNDDLRQEFLVGVSMGIKEANLTIGDPIEFIISRGVFRVKSYFRKHVIQSTIQICDECGNKSRIHKNMSGAYQCLKCGSTHVQTTELDDHNEMTLENICQDAFEEDVISQLMVDSFKSTLTPGTNLYSLYELLMEKGVDRDNPLIKNYISEIAKEWGGTSNQNVVQNLKKLKLRLEKWMAENEMEYATSL